jgi:hypothetical protein
MKLLKNQQIHNLANIVLEEFGPGLTGDELNDKIALLLEDVPGLELVSDREVRRVIKQVRSRYHEIC